MSRAHQLARALPRMDVELILERLAINQHQLSRVIHCSQGSVHRWAMGDPAEGLNRAILDGVTGELRELEATPERVQRWRARLHGAIRCPKGNLDTLRALLAFPSAAERKR